MELTEAQSKLDRLTLENKTLSDTLKEKDDLLIKQNEAISKYEQQSSDSAKQILQLEEQLKAAGLNQEEVLRLRLERERLEREKQQSDRAMESLLSSLEEEHNRKIERLMKEI